MGWRDEYLQASFRGVPFFVRRAELSTGRRTQLHVFPNRDTPQSEDLGRRARRYAVDGYVLGDDFFSQKEDLLRAVEAPGPGRLVHPYYGELLLSCTRVRVVDSNTELRLARFEFEFEESGEELEPTAVVNPKVAADTTKKAGLQAATDAFLEAYSIANKPFAEVQKLQSAITDGTNLIATARRSVGNVADFQRSVLSISSDVTAAINDAAGLAADTIEILAFGTFPFDGDVRVTVDTAKQMFDEIRELFEGTEEVPSDDASPVKAYNDLLERASAVTAAGLIPEVEFESLEQLLESAQFVFDQIDAIEEAGVDNNDMLEALRDARSTIRTDIENRQDRLSRLSELVLPETIPAIVLSNSLYGSIEQEENILRRNGLDHPGFVPGGRPIEVLINV